MSRDQKPGRVKLYSGSGTAPQPPGRETEAAPVEEAPAAAAPPKSSRLLQGVVFVAGAALGGAGFVILPAYL